MCDSSIVLCIKLKAIYDAVRLMSTPRMATTDGDDDDISQ